MATYKGIQGYTVQSLASDPTASADTEGQLWYNSGSNVWKISAQGSGAWATGGTMLAASYYGIGIGTQGAALGVGGAPPPSGVVTSESYDGTTWTEDADLTNTRTNSSGGAGTQAAALIYGTSPSIALVEEWNGTAWSEKGDLTTARAWSSNSTAGTITAALCAGGGTSTPGSLINEEYNGTSWTEKSDLNFARYRAASAGTSTDALVVGDANAPEENKTETWNGTSWTAANDINNGGYAMAGAGGTSSTAWVMGGTPANRRGVGTSKTEHFNGTSWTEVGDVASPLEGAGGAGTTTAGLGMGGYMNPGTSDVSYEWNDPNYTNTTVTTS